MTQEKKLSKVEAIKEASDGLRGSIARELVDESDHVSDATTKLLKFHGTYQQDNRDSRKDRRQQGLDKEYNFMVRNRIPGGKITAEQFLGELNIADDFGNGTLRITTRQGIQLHGVVKGNLWNTIHRINEIKLTTQSACGDVERNVVCCPAPLRHNAIHDQLQDYADEIADHLRPKTRAYHEIWLQDPATGDKQQVVGPPKGPEYDPIYGTAYLPRKFKTGIALCDDNCIDVYDQDAGLLAVTQGNSLVGFNVLVGGGMGTTPSNDNCFPALAKRMAFIAPDHVLPVLTAIVLVQRDFGNRAARNQARMKYLIHNWGLARFKAKVEEYLPQAESICGVPTGTVPRPLADPDPAEVTHHHDHMGWHEQGDGKWFLGLPIENGRVKDDGDVRLKSALREIFQRFKPGGRLTAQQNILLCDLAAPLRHDVEQVLDEHRSDRDDSPRRHRIRSSHRWNREVFTTAGRQRLHQDHLPVNSSHREIPTMLRSPVRRRWFVTDASLLSNPFGGLDQVRMNPPRGSSQLDRPAGPTDPEISFISVQSLDGRPIALLANYSLHYVGGVPSGDVSADYFGYFAKFIAEKLGATDQSPPFVGILSNGTSGDVNNINFPEKSTRKYKRYEKMQEVAGKVASRVFEAHRQIDFHDWVPLAAKQVNLTLKTRQPTTAMIAHFDKVTSGKDDDPRSRHSREEIYADRIAKILKAPKEIHIQLQALRIGDLGISAIPFETFAETGLELKDRSPFGDTFTIELANGSYGYLPTPEQHRLGGYETWLGSSYVEQEASTKIVATLLDLFEALQQDSTNH